MNIFKITPQLLDKYRKISFEMYQILAISICNCNYQLFILPKNVSTQNAHTAIIICSLTIFMWFLGSPWTDRGERCPWPARWKGRQRRRGVARPRGHDWPEGWPRPRRHARSAGSAWTTWHPRQLWLLQLWREYTNVFTIQTSAYIIWRAWQRFLRAGFKKTWCLC